MDLYIFAKDIINTTLSVKKSGVIDEVVLLYIYRVVIIGPIDLKDCLFKI